MSPADAAAVNHIATDLRDRHAIDAEFEARIADRHAHQGGDPMSVNVFWIEGDPPPSTDRAPTLRHQRHAETLRKRPGKWAMLADLEGGYVSAIRNGQIRAYRPGGSFEAVVRRGRVYARYIGEVAR